MTNDDQSATEARPDHDDATGEPSGAGSSSTDENLTRALAAIAAQIRDVKGQLDRLLTIQFDRMRLKLRSGMARMVAGTLALAAGVTAAAAGVVYLTAGAAGAFSELFDGRVWAGDLAAGALALLTMALVVGMVRRSRRKSEMKRLVQKYESRDEGGRSR